MELVIRAFVEGGFFMWLILVCSLLHVVPVVGQFVLVKKADMTPYLWGGLAGIVMLGVLGMLLGLGEALRALAMVSPEYKAAMVARGVAVLVNVGTLTAAVTIPGFFLTGIASVLVRKLRPVRVEG